MSPPPELTFSPYFHKGGPLCSGLQAEWTRCATTSLEEPTWKESENEEAPQSVNCLLLA